MGAISFAGPALRAAFNLREKAALHAGSISIARPRRAKQAMAIRWESLESRLFLSSAPLLIKDINPGAPASDPASFTTAGSLVFFTASPTAGQTQLFASDATGGGTVQLTNDSQAGGAAPTDLTNVNGELFFAANDPSVGVELWKSDGTVGGTAMVTDISAGAGSSNPHGLVAFDNELFFVANDGTGAQVWKSDGTAVGTIAVTQINPGGNTSFDDLAVQGNTLYFVGDNGINGPALWKSDGTNNGTSVVKATGTAEGGGGIGQLTAAANQLFFVASDPTNGYQVWSSDGTFAGTNPIKIIDPGITSASDGPLGLTTIGTVAYFSANDGAAGRQLYRSDGTSAGTSVVGDINPGGASNPTGLANIGGEVYFAADNSTDGVEFWKSDGSSVGTALVKDINPGPADSNPAELINVSGELYFNATDSAHGAQLWKSDGTSNGTQLVSTINPGGDAFDGSGDGMAVASGSLFFAATDGSAGVEPWAYQAYTPALSASTSTLDSSQNPQGIGGAVVFTATVRGPGGAPTGTVAFFNGSTQLGTATLSNGVATYTTTGLGIGQNSITVQYRGDTVFAGNTSLALTQTISSLPASATVLHTTQSPAGSGELLIFTAKVTSSAGTPTGLVNFFDGSVELGQGPLDSAGSATYSTATLSPGSHSITAFYQSDGIFAASTSAAVAQSITNAPASKITLASSAVSIIVGQPLQLSATVAGGGGTPTGNVTFFADGAEVGVAVLQDNGVAVFPVSSLSVGSHSLTSQYGGDGFFAPGTSTTLAENVTPLLDSSVVLTSSQNPANTGDALELTATVTGPGGTPGGTVEFFDGSTPLASATLFPYGAVSLPVSSLAPGSHSLTVQYQGDSTFAPSTSAALTQTVVEPELGSIAPGLGAAAGHIPASVVSGAKLKSVLPIALTNTSAAVVKGTATVTIYASSNAFSVTGATVLATLTKNISLKSQKSLRLKMKVSSLPLSLPDGVYTILVQVTDPSGMTRLDAIGGMVKVAAAFVLPVASLGSITPAAVAPGKHAAVTLSIANSGNTLASGAMTISLVLSLQGLSPVAGQTLLSQTKGVKIKPGATLRLKLRFLIPASLPSGQYTPLVSVTLDGVSANSAGAAFTVP